MLNRTLEIRTEKYPPDLVIRKSSVIFKRVVSALGGDTAEKRSIGGGTKNGFVLGQEKGGVEKSRERVEI